MITMRLQGAREVEQMLRNMPKKEAKSAVRKGMRRAAKTIQGTAKAYCPVATGRLQRAIKLRQGRGRPGIYSMQVRINPGKSRNDEGGAWYAPFVEYGYIQGGKHHPGKHFMQAAGDVAGPPAAQQAVEEIGDEIEKAAKV
jgi:HK97 gp10 family phage protein